MDRTKQSDEWVVGRVLAGNRGDLSILVERYLPVVQAVAVARVGNRVDAEDIVQETFLKALQALHTLRNRARFGPWLLTIARNVCHTLHRSRSRELPLGETAAQPAQAAPDLEHAEVLEFLHQQLLRLDADKREVLLLHYFAGNTLDEIAQLLGLRRAAVAKRLQRAREALGESLLKRMEGAPASYRPSREKVSSLMVVLAAAPTHWEVAATAGAVATLAGSGTAMKAFLAACALLGVFGIGALVLRHVPSANMPVPTGAGIPTATTEATAPAPPADSMPSARGETVPAAASSAQTDPIVAPTGKVDLTNAQAVWARVMEVNRVWLDPRPKHLTYTFNMSAAQSGQPENAIRVWVAGERGRVEAVMGDDDKAEMVYAGGTAVSLSPPKALQSSPHPMPTNAAYRQGVTWRTALHEWAETGLPSTAKIVETGDDDTVVIEADGLKCSGDVGLGLYRTWFGESQYGIARARIHIRVSDFVPVEEEDFYADPKTSELKNAGVVVMGPEFLTIGTMRAPNRLEYNSVIRGEKEVVWVLRADFQEVGGAWVLREGQNIHDGKLVNRVYTTGVSAAPFDAALLDMPDETELAALKNATPVIDSPNPGAVDSPQVVECGPSDGAVDVPIETELRLRFDRPMNPALIAIDFEKGGFSDCDAPRYDAQTQEFVLAVRLLPGAEHQLVINQDKSLMSTGFQSTEGVRAAGFRWCFQTGGKTAATGEKPKATSVTPGADTVMGLLTPFAVTFDRPMEPSAFNIRPSIDGKPCTDYFSTPQLLADVQYDSKENRFELPVQFPPNWEGELEFSGFQSAEGTPAEPVVLHVKSGTEPLSPGLRERLALAAKDPRLHALLAQMQAVSRGLTSLSETARGVQCGSFGQGGSYTSIRGMGATAKFQGERQFFADATETMRSSTFVIGCDGEQWWWHFKSNMGDQEEFIRVLPFDEVNDRDILIGNPFNLRQGDISKIIEENFLEYLGTEEFDGRSCHVLRTTEVRGAGKRCVTVINRLLIDAEKLLPVRVQMFHPGILSVGGFTHDRINQPIPDEEFAVPSIEGVVPEPDEPLGEGYDTRHVIIHDGGGNSPAVRWGKRGPKATSSSGFS